LANHAKQQLDAGHLDDAELEFQKAYVIARVPTLAVWTARVKVKRGEWVGAAELYRQALQLSPNDFWVGNAQDKAQTDAKNELDTLETRIPKLRVRIRGAAPAEVELTIDSTKADSDWGETALALDPGHHRLVGKRNTQTAELGIDLAEGENKEVSLTFDEAPALASQTELIAPLSGKALSLTAEQDQRAAELTRAPSVPKRSASPFYAKWWFWTGVGAAVVAGTVTAIVLTRHSGGACSGASYTCVEVP
jgi:hypothetical protein